MSSFAQLHLHSRRSGRGSESCHGQTAFVGGLVVLAHKANLAVIVAALGGSGATATIKSRLLKSKEIKGYKNILSQFVKALGGNVGHVHDNCGSLEDEIATLLDLPESARIHGSFSRAKGDRRENAVRKHLGNVKLKGFWSRHAAREELRIILLVRELRQTLNKEIVLSVMGITNAGKSTVVGQFTNSDTYADEWYSPSTAVLFFAGSRLTCICRCDQLI